MIRPSINPMKQGPADTPKQTRPLPPPPPPEAPRTHVRSLDEILTDAIAFYTHGAGNGETTHWACMDEYWTWMKKEITVITGYPNHGKSRKAHHLMLIKAAIKKWKFAVYVAENEDDFYVEMAQMLVGRTANIKFKNNRMSMEELKIAISWLHEHFIMVIAPDGCTPKELLESFAELHEKHTLDGVLIDPWNQLTHDWQSREDVYLSTQFSLLKRFAIKYQQCLLVTAHPAGQVKDKAGNLLRPDAYSISGGKMWNNKFDNVMAVFRPDFPSPAVELWIHKIKKQGRVGKPGLLSLTFDLPQFRYFPVIGPRSHPLDTVSFNAPGTTAEQPPQEPAPAYNPHANLQPGEVYNGPPKF